jgi:hypothetical protein
MRGTRTLATGCALALLACTQAAAATPLTGTSNPEHLACAREAAVEYGVPLVVVLLLLKVEGGWPGAEVANKPRKDGSVTYDLGPMQINDAAWGTFFGRLGITREMLRDDACVNIHAGTWIVASHYRDIVAERRRDGRDASGAFPEAMLRYHSRTPDRQEAYSSAIERAFARGVQSAGRASPPAVAAAQ